MNAKVPDPLQGFETKPTQILFMVEQRVG